MTLSHASGAYAPPPFVALLVVALVASPAVSAKDIRISGSGTRSCTEWQAWKDEQKGEPRAMTIEWAQGFISGHNVYARVGSEPVNSVVADSRTLATLLDTYCQKNPQSRVLNGVIEIAKSLGGAGINLTPKAPGAKPPAGGKGKPEREV